MSALKEYKVYGPHVQSSEVGFVVAANGKEAIAEAKKRFPWIFHPVVFNREDFKKAIYLDIQLRKSERVQRDLERELETV